MRKALTMAELLVTMTIVGAIAVLVLPGFLKDYHNKLYVTKLKKVYETYEHAVNQACLDYSVSSFKYTPYSTPKTNAETGKLYQQEFLEKYFKKSDTQIANPFASIRYKKIGGTSASKLSITDTSNGFAKLASGEIVAFYCTSGASKSCSLRVDVNGPEGPNIGGRDLFRMYVDLDTNEIYDAQTTRNYCGNGTSGTAQYSSDGRGCFGRILKDNWEMKY